MEQNKTLYETVFIVNNTLGEEAVKSLVEKFTGLIETPKNCKKGNKNEVFEDNK